MIYYEKCKESDRLRCLICPHRCVIHTGASGICGVRKNDGERIVLDTWGVISGYALDPVEKKPLYHFFPGKKILSVGSYGCNMRCDFCQNYSISQNTGNLGNIRLTPAELVSRASLAEGNTGIAYTYNEPLIWHEYVTECAALASEAGLKNVMVTNGYFNSKPLSELLEVIDAFNVDLKAFDDEFYRRYTGASLGPVLEAVKSIASADRHLELTSLIIPGLNDSDASMHREAEWIATYAGRKVPLHLSRYYPMYKRADPPTPESTIIRLKEIASEYLDFVYTGNLPPSAGGSDTLCPSCHKTVVKRRGYETAASGLDDKGRCLNCNELIIKYF